MQAIRLSAVMQYLIGLQALIKDSIPRQISNHLRAFVPGTRRLHIPMSITRSVNVIKLRDPEVFRSRMLEG